MTMFNTNLSCLYYPFSRLLDETTLKYLLLVFDNITFLDEARSTDGRRYLMQVMSRSIDTRYSSYERIADEYDLLVDEKIVHIVNPNTLKTGASKQLALATLADLSDKSFVNMASRPDLYSLPYRTLDYYDLSPADRPTWQVFQGKLPRYLWDNSILVDNETWAQHVLRPGNENRYWTLSYEAGSAAILNYYLESAQELNLTPITTSEFHHQLVLQKLKRIFSERQEKIEFLDDYERKRFRVISGQGEIIKMLGGLFPASQLKAVSFTEILKFRKETSHIRNAFVQDIDKAIRLIDDDPTTTKYDRNVVEAIQVLENDFRKSEQEMAAIRDKILPALGKAMMYGSAGSGALSALASFLGGLSPEGVVTASALTITGAFFAEMLELWNEKRQVLRSQRASLSYLTKVSELVR